ncbi:hypothetical protein V6N98_001558 [Campylobacter upsaliensis]
MNCFNHNKKVAVGACQNYNIGLCNECITNALIISLCLWKFFMGFFHLGFWGFLARFERSENFNNSAAGVTQAIKDCDMYKDGSIWIVWVFKFAFFILRGAFFPLFYLNLMLFGSIKLQNELKECEKIKTELNA